MQGEIEVVRLYSEDISREMTIRQISKEMGKSYAYTNGLVWKMIKEGVLKSREIGKAVVCSINISNKMAQELLAFGSFLHTKLSNEKDFDDSYFAFKYGSKVISVGPKGMSLKEFSDFVKSKGHGKPVYGFEKYWEKVGDIYA